VLLEGTRAGLHEQVQWQIITSEFNQGGHVLLEGARAGLQGQVQ
jgi:hypothetical protein